MRFSFTRSLSRNEDSVDLDTKNDLSTTLPREESGSSPAESFAGRNTAGAGIITEPEKFDILCGQPKTFDKHTGNQVFRNVIETWVETYEHAKSKQEKININKQIVNMLQTKYNARFIKPLNYRRRSSFEEHREWEEISDALAKDKVGHAFRTAIKRMRRGSESSRKSDTTSNNASGVESCRKVSDASTLSTSSGGRTSFTFPFQFNRPKDNMPKTGKTENGTRSKASLVGDSLSSEDVKDMMNAPMDTIRSEDLNSATNASIRSEDMKEVVHEPAVSLREVSMRSNMSVVLNDPLDSLRSEDLNSAAREAIGDTLRSKDLEDLLDGPLQSLRSLDLNAGVTKKCE